MLQVHSFVAWVAGALQPEPNNDLLKIVRESIRRHAAEPPGSWLGSRLGLGESEQHVVWLLAAIALEPTVRARVATIDGNAFGDPTLDGIRRIVYGGTSSIDSLSQLSDRGRLRALRIIERSDGGPPDLHETRQTWALSRRVLEMLHGGDAVDDALAELVSVPEAIARVDDLAMSPDTVADVREALRHGREHSVVCVAGMQATGRRTLLVAAAAERELAVLQIHTGGLAKLDRSALVPTLRAVARECRLQQRVPIFLGADELSPELSQLVASEIVAQLETLILATSRSAQPNIHWRGRSTIIIEVGRPTTAQSAALWLTALGDANDATRLASQFPMAPGLIVRAAEAAKARIEPGAACEEADVRAGIRTVLDDKLSAYAKRVHVSQTWDDLVLAGDQVASINELIARIRQRTTVFEDWGFAAKVGNKGLGVTALFHGVPGSGKSMVCGLIASELGLDLYAVDMSRITSKWVGETEKALAELFDAAEAAHAAILIDEADSLLGKRTDQKSSNDRYANQTTNFLLYRLEAYEGIVFMTTNHEANIDPAFARRMSLRLRFDMPEPEERAKLWRAMLPKNAPIDARIDFRSLAERFVISGGHIRNAVLRSAFLAADAEQPKITQALLEHGARVEAESIGLIVSGLT